MPLLLSTLLEIHELIGGAIVKLNKPVRIMFQDEAGFGRINTPKYCWTGGDRPTVPCHHIREYRYVFGAVDPCSGDDCFLVAPPMQYSMHERFSS